MSTRMPKETRTFTLVELLVVVAIIGVLAAFLMPALRKAQLMAQSSTCMNNEKQQGVAVGMYSNENNGYLPVDAFDKPDLSGAGSPTRWKYEIAPYIGLGNQITGDCTQAVWGKGIFYCPSRIRVERGKIDNTPISDGWIGGYGWNFVYLGSAPCGLPGSPRAKAGRISKPSQTLMTADTADVWTYYYVARALPPSAFGQKEIGDRHNNGLNVLWADGHVGWMSKLLITMGKPGNIDWYYRVTK